MEPREKYYEYWGLHKPPFDNVPDPSMYFDMHTSVENAVAETLFAIEEGNECLVVIVGDVGLGKTMTLRVIVDALEPEKYRIAFVTNPDMTFMQLLREILGQLTGEQCTESRREHILEAFNRTLFEAREAGKKVLIFIDEANAMKPAALESLRLLTNMQSDDENLLTIVLAGQLELARRLEHPRRANLFQRIGVYCRLHKIESRDLVRDYIEHRLERAGTRQRLFTEAAYDAIWEYSEHGVPRLINKIAKLALKAGQTHRLTRLDAPLIHQIGARFRHMSEAMPPERRDRVRAPALSPQEPLLVEAPSAAPPPSAAAPSPPPPAAVGHAQPAAMAEIIKFPEHIYAKARKMPPEQRLRYAGQLAAEVLKRYPHLIQQFGANNDPVPAWNVLRNVVMRQIEQRLTGEAAPVAAPH